MPLDLPLTHTYATLPPRFFQQVAPTPVGLPAWLAFNHELAAELGIADAAGVDAEAGLAVFAGNALPPSARPLAMAYAGHQFGHFVPQLGDGRAILLGELVDVHGVRRDLQLKGAGRTAFSRGGDGRAVVGPVLREVIIGEALHALGIPTTRALAAVATGEPVLRDRGPLPGAVLTRVAASHVRVGTFEFFAARGDVEALRRLADYVIDRHYPELASAAPHEAALALLRAVSERQAALLAMWMAVGFVHGVMNTDNMAVSGESIDFGPCAFLDEYAPGKTFSSIDRHGRYAFANQPVIAQWNLARLGECLLPLMIAPGSAIPDEAAAVAAATAELQAFPARFEAQWQARLRARLGLVETRDGDDGLAADLLAAMHAAGADWTLTFRRLAEWVEDGFAAGEAGAVDPVDAFGAGARAPLPMDPVAPADFLAPWLPRWRERLAAEARPPQQVAAATRAVAPAVIPRNHQVEAALRAAEDGELAPFRALLAAVRRPFADDAAQQPFIAAPAPAARVCATFCGT
ncbi:protein adenylyltransferase SelO [Arenimonas composti]|uniref:Protein nucleotidyltransferase YdiU n=1 Tax=Arenimonas composti TR7-09 = DSM 18010 TaxID=1121013 RepID=A0A091BDA2_9GAMM|nr:YdiU family protein [Arenimonas composti]KFN49467.1 hypothetical protein P873_10870 [Arenimonas composti TR7-09 = DSM 18010]